jgi:hypothetical protein
MNLMNIKYSIEALIKDLNQLFFTLYMQCNNQCKNGLSDQGHNMAHQFQSILFYD